MLDIKLIRSNPELVKENIKKKFQDEKLPLVDEVLELDAQFRASKGRGDELRQQRNTISKEIGKLMSQGKKDEAQEVKKQVQAIAGELEEMERKEAEMTAEIRKRMLVIPQPHRRLRAHWQGRQRKRGSAALWRACGARLRGALPHRDYGALRGASTWTAPARPAATASTISWATLPGSSPR